MTFRDGDRLTPKFLKRIGLFRKEMTPEAFAIAFPHTARAFAARERLSKKRKTRASTKQSPEPSAKPSTKQSPKPSAKRKTAKQRK